MAPPAVRAPKVTAKAAAAKTAKSAPEKGASQQTPAPQPQTSEPAAKPVSQTPAAAPSPAPDSGSNAESAAPSAGTSDEDGTGTQFTLGKVFGVPFMQRALLAGLIVGALAGYLGVFVVLKRVVFVGVSLAEVSSAGIALGLALGLSPVLGSLALMLGGVVLFSSRPGGKRIPPDAVIGAGYAAASAAAVLLVASSPRGEAHMLDLMFGNILTVTGWDVAVLGIGSVCVAAALWLFAKELLFTAFDPETAAASGYSARRWEVFLYLMIGVVIALGIRATGVLFTFASLVVPASTALLVSRRFRRCTVWSVLIGVLPVPIGLWLSFTRDLPASPAIVAVGCVALAVAMAGRGLVSALQRRA